MKPDPVIQNHGASTPLQRSSGASALNPDWQERREVQFLVERMCPDVEASPLAIPVPAGYLPRVFWVQWPPIHASDVPYGDCSAVTLYRVTQREFQKLCELIGPDKSPGIYLCEHMGRLIE